MKITAMMAIHGVQMKYFVRLRFLPLYDLPFTLLQSSCAAPAGHTHPHHALPKNSEVMNNPAKTMKSPAMMPSVAPIMMRYGDK